MADATGKGESLIYESQKKMKSWNPFNTTKYEEAAELLAKAGAQFKIAKDWERAGECYMEAASLYERGSDGELEAKECYENAAKCFQKTSPENAIKIYRQMAEKLMNDNSFSRAAKMYKTVGELSETANDLDSAIEAYEKSADCFNAEEQSASATQVLYKVAEISALKDDFKKAIDTFEQVATMSLDSRLLSYKCKDYYIQAIMCHMAQSVTDGNVEDAEVAWSKYRDNYPAIDGTREAEFIDKSLEAIRDCELDNFEDALLKFDTYVKLDDWKSNLVRKIRKGIKELATKDDVL